MLNPHPPAPDGAAPSADRRALRQRLLAERDAFAVVPGFAAAQANLSRHLAQLIRQLEPQCLGVYWPIRSEFNAPAACAADKALAALPLALPFARKTKEMHYRLWDGCPPTLRDECGILTSGGVPATPDVVLVPCVGFTLGGYRLGYGGGYFDRWLALHPEVTAIGVAWAGATVADADLVPQPHDQPLMAVVTEDGVVGGASAG